MAELGVSFVSLTEALDLTTPTDRAMAQRGEKHSLCDSRAIHLKPFGRN
jgi:hypothetical protein